jgi:hypothetical protein
MANVVRTTNKPLPKQQEKASNGKEKETKESVAPRTPEVKAAKFKEIAQRRTRQAVRIITGLGNLSNKGNYEFTPEQLDKIFKALHEALNETQAKFDAKVKQSAPGFEL